MNVAFLDLARGYAAVAAEADARILEVARSGAYVLGRNGAALEQAVARYVGVNHGVGCNSGTDALHLALAALGVGPGDEVVTTPFTFAATLEAIEYVGAQAVLADIDRVTFNLDPDAVAAAVTPKTRALLPVHLFGLPAAMAPLMDVAARHRLVVLEDCAQSFGASIDGRRIGGIGHAGALSFYPTKTLGGFGDGGMVVTDDEDVARRLRVLRNHGIGDGGEHVELGWNSRLDDVQAALLLVRLARLDAMNERRRAIAARYDEALSPAGATTPRAPPGATHVFGYYTILVDDRDAVRLQLQQAGVATAVYYPRPLHRHAHFARTTRAGPLPAAEDVARRCMSLPIFPEMTDDEVDYVATTLARILRG
jgi:dTDP-4-amino-4,6-dideoxygalactose transaminase